MKKVICSLAFLLSCMLFGSCSVLDLNKVPDTSANSTVSSETEQPMSSAATTVSPTAETTETPQPTANPTAAIEPTAIQTPIGMGPLPTNSAPMYSSYAHMVSYDPARGCADFDYFNILKGDDAVQWLVKEKGYTQAEAEAEVAEYADSEFIESNVNPQLRTIDLREIPLKMMYHSDGTPVEDSNAIDSDLSDLFSIYELDPKKILNSYFYYIHVENGQVVSVEQVYWA